MIHLQGKKEEIPLNWDDMVPYCIVADAVEFSFFLLHGLDAQMPLDHYRTTLPHPHGWHGKLY